MIFFLTYCICFVVSPANPAKKPAVAGANDVPVYEQSGTGDPNLALLRPDETEFVTGDVRPLQDAPTLSLSALRGS